MGKYISIEKQIEKTKDRYYDTLEASDAGWHEEENDPIPFIRQWMMGWRTWITIYGTGYNWIRQA